MATSTTITLTQTAAPISSTAGTHRRRHTAYDVMERMLSFLGGNPDRVTHRDIKRAIEDAYREFPTLHEWMYLYALGRIQLHAAQDTGTVAYDHTGGTYERMLTLAGATWPTWAERAHVRIADVVYLVDKRVSSTVLTLTDDHNPGADLAAGTAYSMGEDHYVLPSDFLASDRAIAENNWGGLYYVRPHEWLAELRAVEGTGQPRCYTFTGDPKGTGALVLRLRPTPDQDQTLDFLYRRALRPIRFWDRTTGKASIANGSTTVTLGGGGTFTAAMVGSVIRLSDGSQDVPDGTDSPEEYALERTVVEVLTSTTAQVDEAADAAYTSVAYRLSDPIDVEDESMFNAVVAGARNHLAIARAREDAPAVNAQWLFLLHLAQQADNRDTARRRAGVAGAYRQRLADMPRGQDVE
jgi:hypothetical protein